LNFAVNGSETCCDGGCKVAVTYDGSWCHFFFWERKRECCCFWLLSRCSVFVSEVCVNLCRYILFSKRRESRFEKGTSNTFRTRIFRPADFLAYYYCQFSKRVFSFSFPWEIFFGCWLILWKSNIILTFYMKITTTF
jgi:hypothetical protein